jgi:peptidoglycan/LPS O-acetylase OafA/YrhL
MASAPSSSASRAGTRTSRPAQAHQSIPRYDGVDLLRGLSIAAVILLHTQLMFFFNGISIGGTLPLWLRHLLFANGGNGVRVFFAISGFLITTTSLRRFGSLAHMRLGRFYRIRFARIAPPLLLLLAVLAALHLGNVHYFHIRPKVGTLPQALFVALTFQLNWFEAQHGYLPAVWSVLWSLSVEEMFYLFFPLVCLALLCFDRLRPRLGTFLFLAALLAFVVAGPFARTAWTSNEVWQDQSYLSGMSSIALGCLTALLTQWLLARRVALSRSLLRTLAVAGTFLLFIIALWPLNPHAVRSFLGRSGLDETVLALGTCLFMAATVLLSAQPNGRPGRVPGLLTLPLRWFGRYSYELYLTHEFLVIWGVHLYLHFHAPGAPTPPTSIAFFVVAILLATAPLGFLLAHLVSEPLNRRLRGAPLPQQLRPRPRLR